jgi:hypothetical protein
MDSFKQLYFCNLNFLETLAGLSTLKKVSQFTILSWHCIEINSHIVLEVLIFFPFVQE